MKYFGIFESVVNGLGIMVGVASVESVLGIILLILSICSIVVRAVISIVQWRKKAKADGKISEEELKELDSYVENGQKEINEIISKKENLKK